MTLRAFDYRKSMVKKELKIADSKLMKQQFKPGINNTKRKNVTMFRTENELLNESVKKKDQMIQDLNKDIQILIKQKNDLIEENCRKDQRISSIQADAAIQIEGLKVELKT